LNRKNGADQITSIPQFFPGREESKNGVIIVLETSEVFKNLGGLVGIIGVRREA
jgi:hypothetical protein